MFETYKPSGKFGGLLIPMWLLGLAVCIGLAFVYHLALHYIPFIYINFMVSIGLGLALAFVGGMIVKSGKVRNKLIGVLIACSLLGTTLAAKYFFQHRQMVSDAVAMVVEMADPENGTAEEIAQVVKENLTFSEHIKARVETGWSIGKPGQNGGAPLSGMFVYGIWLLEALIVGWTPFFSVPSAAGEPYSEKLDSWASESETVMTLPITDQDMVTKIKSATTVEELFEIPIPKTDASNQFAVYRVDSIEGQEMEDAYLSVDLLTITQNSKGETDTDTKSLVKHAILTTANRKQLVENAELLQEAIADYQEALEEDAAESGEQA